MNASLAIPIISLIVLIGSAIGMFFLAKDAKRRNSVYTKFTRPSHFDYDVVVIGAGAGGLAAARQAAELRAKVLVIEKKALGGDHLYAGCVPSKSLLRSAAVAHLFRRGNEFGLQSVTPQTDFSRVFTRVHNAIHKLEPLHSADTLTAAGIDHLIGEARIADPFRVNIGERIVTARNIIIATGAGPVIPEIPGLMEVPHYTSETVWHMKWVPKRLLVLGGGPIGCELAQAFQRLGCETVLVEQRATLLRKEDPDVIEAITRRFQSEGLTLRLGTEIKEFEKKGNGGRATFRNGETLDFDAVLVALGRRARTNGFGGDDLELGLRRDGTLEVDSQLRTKYGNVFAVGDVAGPLQFTHSAANQGRVAAMNALFAPVQSFKIDYTATPWCTYTDPEIARMGLNEGMAKERRVEVDIHRYSFEHVDRAVCDGEDYGFIKVLTAKGEGTILGVTIVGPHAGEALPEFSLAMRKNLSLKDIHDNIHAYPTLSDINRLVAREWRKRVLPRQAVNLFTRFHMWRRG